MIVIYNKKSKVYPELLKQVLPPNSSARSHKFLASSEPPGFGYFNLYCLDLILTEANILITKLFVNLLSLK